MKYTVSVPYSQVQICRATGTIFVEIEAASENEAINTFKHNWDDDVFMPELDPVEDDFEVENYEDFELDLELIKADPV